MDQQSTPRIADPPANQQSPMVKQNPPGFQQAPPGGPPRFPLNNGPGQPPPLRHLDSRSSLIPGQFPQPRPPYGPRPRNFFYPRSPQPGQPPGPPGPQGQVPGSPGQAGPPQGFQGPRFIQNPNIRGPLPPQRPPFPGNNQPFFQRNGSEQIRGIVEFGPNQKLQRNDSIANLNPRFPIPADRRPQLIPQISVERMADEGSKLMTTAQADVESPKKLARENDDDDDDVVVDNEKSSNKVETPVKSPHVSGTASPIRQDSSASEAKSNDLDKVSLSNSIHNSPTNQASSPAHLQSSAPGSRPPSASLSPNKTPFASRPASAISNKSEKVLENKNDDELTNDEVIKSPSKSPDILNGIISSDNTDDALNMQQIESPLENNSKIKDEVNLDDVVQAKLPIPGTPTKPKTPESVKGFDNGKRRSLSSRSSSESKSPKSPRSPGMKTPDQDKKRTTFADMEEMGNDEENGEVDPEESTSKSGCTTPTTPRKRLPSGSRSSSKESRRSLSARRAKPDAENDSGVDESTQRAEAPTLNGIRSSPTKRTSSKSREADKRSTVSSPIKSPSKSAKSLPRTPDAASSTTIQDKKKVPMNKVQVGATPSPNLKTVKSKIGSLGNTSYKPGGGNIKIENRKLDFSKAQPKITAKNDKYAPSGGDKKIQQVKLQWNAKSKVGSLDNTTHKPGGGDKKIESMKLDFKDKAKPKVGSKENAKHVPGGGTIKSSETPPQTPLQDSPTEDIETQKIDIKAESKIGSLDNVKHKPGGGEKKIFNDKDYLRQTGSNAESLNGSGSQSPIPSSAINNGKNGLPPSDENLNQEC